MRGLKWKAVGFAFGLLLLTSYPIPKPPMGELRFIPAAWADPEVSNQLEETKKSWMRRRLQEFRRGICRLSGIKGSAEERAAAFASEVERVKGRFTDATARALGLPELKPKDIKVSGTMLMFKLGTDPYVLSCISDDEAPPADLLPEAAMCSDTNTLPRQIAEVLNTVNGAYPEAGEMICPPHLKLAREKGATRCINPCPDDRPHYVRREYWPGAEDEDFADDCQPCPDNFPTYSEEKMDCVDTEGCTHHEGHYKTPEGKFKCGKDCPPGWKSIGSGLCQEDLAKACAYCQKAITALETWQLQIPDSGRKPSNPSSEDSSINCTRQEAQEVFEAYKSTRLAEARKNQQECRKMQRTPRVVPVDQIAFVHLASTPCVGDMMGNGRDEMSHTAAADYKCAFPRKWVDSPQYDDGELKQVFSRYGVAP